MEQTLLTNQAKLQLIEKNMIPTVRALVAMRASFNRFSKLPSFSTFIVNNPTTGKPCVEFPSTDSQEYILQQDKLMEQGRAKWNLLTIPERKEKITAFVNTLESNKAELISLLTSSTGKHQESAELEVLASIQMLKQDLNEECPKEKHKKSGRYYFKAFGNILVVFDYRMVMINSLKYLVSCGIAGNCITFNPHRYALPVAKKVQQIWRTTHPEYPLIYCPVNNYADGLEHMVQKKDMGFVSFSGDIESGNAFYHFMAQKSQIFAQSQFLLMSSDSAYVLKDLTEEKLAKAAQNLAMACFSSGGNLFNSVKRIYVDEQISKRFIQLFVQASTIYKIKAESSKSTPIITSSHMETSKSLLAQLCNYRGPQLLGLTQIQTKDSYKSLYISPLIYKVEGIPTIQYWNKIYPMPICFIQSVSSVQTAIQQINSSNFGITAVIYTSDRSKIQEIGRDLDVGVVYGNRWGFTPGVPYSPRKRSGKGESVSMHCYTNVTRSQSLKGFPSHL